MWKNKNEVKKKHKKKVFYAKTFLRNVIFYQIVMLFKFLKISYILLWF